ncbi:hypothetical protein HH214_14720 [Mucilaginibacter robiniae]|uniref:Uncharacterized protein n=1 Tax=Mucilaginibacter robiniae TaxID=2728022 RepID=A0A7L5E1W8_9SPHI|nr:hypothetical protein [Mucilaginibacter robiniae]QJD97031.1 hypothetical protein HH214_14720 [Mucilaginibacter robiniae]
MKNLFFLLIILLSGPVFAQDVVQHESKLTPIIKETYNVLKSDNKTLQGQYAAYYKKQLVAAGKYDKNARIGYWTFFDIHGKLMQRYNYNDRTLNYEAPEDTTSSFRYMIDQNIDTTTRATKPVRLGGRYFGYLRYLNLFKLPGELVGLNDNLYAITIELLVSPGGRLADYKVHIQSRMDKDENQTFNMNINLLKDEDKMFLPATYNHVPVSATIFIRCHLSGKDRIEID